MRKVSMYDKSSDQSKPPFLFFLRRHSIAVSGLIVLLCLAVLVGATYALFSDMVTNVNNIIQTGNMKVGFEVSDQLSGESDLDTKSPKYQDLKANAKAAIFTGDASNWKPGDKGTTYLKISNQGSMTLNYELSFSPTDGGLAGSLTFTITKISGKGEITGVSSGDSVSGSDLNSVCLKHDAMGKGEEFDLYQLDYVLSDSLDNIYNHDGEAPYFKLDVTLSAQQQKSS